MFSTIHNTDVLPKARNSYRKPFKNGKGASIEKEVSDVNVGVPAAHSFSKIVRTAECGIGAANFVTVKDEHSDVYESLVRRRVLK